MKNLVLAFLLLFSGASWAGVSPVSTIPVMVYGAGYASSTVLLANTPETVFSAAANVRGAVVWSANITWQSVTNAYPVFIANTLAPVSTVNGIVILSCNKSVTTGPFCSGSLINPVYIPAGNGLFYISGGAETSTFRSVLYTLY